jgi:hypothetical protein
MNLARRIKNLWRLSEYEVTQSKEEFDNLPVGTKVSPIVKKPQMAQIIKVNRKDPIDEFIESK